MRKIRIQSGEEVVICKSRDTKPSGAVWFLEEEWEWFQKLAKSMHVREERDTFMQGVVESKKADPAFSVLHAFPRGESEGSTDPSLHATSSLDNGGIDARKKPDFSGAAICEEVIQRLKGTGAMTFQERRKEGEESA